MKNNLFEIRHSAEHLLMQAMKELGYEFFMAMGPATDEGFYFDFELLQGELTENDFETIENKMQEIIDEYENNIINSSKVIERLIELAKEIKEAGEAGKDLGLTPEEMAFYDALSQGKKALKDDKLKQIVKEIIHTLKRDIAIDWTDHEIIKARVRADVRMVLLRNNFSFEEVDKMVEKVYIQAESLYRDYPSIYI